MPALELALATSIWGFSFVATVWAFEFWSPLWITALRFLASSLILAIYFGIRFLRARSSPPISDQPARSRLSRPALSRLSRKRFLLASVTGILLSTTLYLQTLGQVYTSVTRAGFILTLYIVLIPFMERGFLKRKIPSIHFVWVTLALVGTALICGVTPGEIVSHINRGDVLTFVSAIAASMQIISISAVVKKIPDALEFNFYQGIWAGGFALILALGFDRGPIMRPVLGTPLAAHLAWFGLGFLVVFSSLLAFLIQIRAQKKLSASVASLIYLLESPIAAVCSVIFLAEVLTASQILGGVIIFAASLASVAFAQKTA